MKITISVGRCLNRKTMLVWVKEYINKNFATCKSLARIIYCAQRRTPKYKYWVLKVLCLKTEMVCSGWLLVIAMDWDLTCKDLVKKIVYSPESNKCLMDWYESCPGTATLKVQLLIKNSTNVKMMWKLLSVVHYGLCDIDNFYLHFQETQRDFDWCYWWFNKTFLYCKAKYYQFLMQDKI